MSVGEYNWEKDFTVPGLSDAVLWIDIVGGTQKKCISTALKSASKIFGHDPRNLSLGFLFVRTRYVLSLLPVF